MEEGVCIYCKQLSQLTDEHVLPRNLGGNLKPALVCDPCRRATNAMDQSLAEHSWVGMARIGVVQETAFAVKLGGIAFHFDEDYGFHVEHVFRNRFRPDPLPQMHLTKSPPGANFSLIAGSKEGVARLINFLRDRIASGTLHKLHVEVGPSEYCEHPRVVMHRNDTAFVRVPVAGMEHVLFSVLEKGIEEIAAQASGTPRESTVEKPRMHWTGSFHVGDALRAVAKIAFSVLAVHVPRERIIDPQFDLIRDYIRHNEWPTKEEDLKSAEGVVSPFVRIISPKDNASAIDAKGQHAVTLLSTDSGTFAEVQLSGRLGHFIVELSPRPCGELEMLVHVFSTDRTSHRVYKGAEILGVMTVEHQAAYAKLQQRGQ